MAFTSGKLGGGGGKSSGGAKTIIKKVKKGIKEDFKKSGNPFSENGSDIKRALIGSTAPILSVYSKRLTKNKEKIDSPQGHLTVFGLKDLKNTVIEVEK